MSKKIQDPSDRCLQCGDTRESLKRSGYSCGIMSGGEEPELVDDFPRHRFRPWGDQFLSSAGIKSESFSKYRTAQIMDLQWAACEDQVRGHSLATEESDYEDFGARVGSCIKCGKTPETVKETV